MTDDRRRQNPIGRRLRQLYQHVADQDVPEDFLGLLRDAELRMEAKRQEIARRQRPPSSDDPDRALRDYRYSRRRQDAIGRGLRQMYETVVNEDVPDEFIKLLGDIGLRLELDEMRRKRKRPPKGEPDEPVPHDAPRPNPKRPLLSSAAQLEWDGPLANPRSERRPGPHAAPALRRRKDDLGQRLRQMYDDINQEPLPDSFPGADGSDASGGSASPPAGPLAPKPD